MHFTVFRLWKTSRGRQALLRVYRPPGVDVGNILLATWGRAVFAKCIRTRLFQSWGTIPASMPVWLLWLWTLPSFYTANRRMFDRSFSLAYIFTYLSYLQIVTELN